MILRAAESPVPATWCAAIDKGDYATWSGLTASLVKKYFQKRSRNNERPHTIDP